MANSVNEYASCIGDLSLLDNIIKVISVNERYFVMAFDENSDKPYATWECGLDFNFCDLDFNFYDVQYIYNKVDAVKNLYRRASLYLERIADTDISNVKLEESATWCGATRDEWAELY